MTALLNDSNDAAELLKVLSLLRLEWVLDEKWDDAFTQMLLPTYSVSHPVAVVATNHTTTEVLFESVKHLYIALVLHDGEFREHLISALHRVVRIDAHVKTAFTVHEANYPLCV